MDNSYASPPSIISFARSAVQLRRMRRFVATTSAGTDGILLLFPMYALVASGVRFPDVMLFFAGEGGEGEFRLRSTLGRADWGSGHSEASAAMLQEADEFRNQGHLYRTPRWASFDESKPTAGLSGGYPRYSALAECLR